jgi:branched-chain amino acid transport system substrate-binding protein
MLNRRSMLMGAVAAGSGATLLVQANSAHAQIGGKPINIGAALPMSGFAAADGIEFKNGLELAIEDINSAGGVLGQSLVLQVEDTGEMGADNTSQAMQRLIDRFEVPVIINGYNNSTNMVEMDVAAENDVIFMHYNTLISHNTKFLSDTERYYGCFQGDPPEYFYGPGLLTYLNMLVETGQWTPSNKKIALVASSIEYPIVIANAVRDQAAQFGWEISLYEQVAFPNNQWGPTLAKIRQDEPGVIAVTHFLPQDLAAFMQQFAPQPTKSLIYMQYGPSLPAFKEIGGKDVEGVLYSTVIGCLPDEFSADFRTKYRAKFGENAAYLTGSQTYDGLWKWAIAAAIAAGPGAPFDKDQAKKVAAAMNALVYRGVNGVCRFDPAGQSSYCYPAQTLDPSLGMPHQFLQHQDIAQDPILVAPAIYAKGAFKLPSWLS